MDGDRKCVGVSAAAVIALFADFAPETTSLTPIIKAFRFATRGNGGPSLSPPGAASLGELPAQDCLPNGPVFGILSPGSVAFVPELASWPRAPIARAFSELEDMRFSFVELEFHGCAKMEH